VKAVRIRQATADDAALLRRFIIELAIYEKAETEVTATVDDIRESLFGAEAAARALICEIGEEAAGFAVYFFNYSTWLGRRGLYLEDLYVSPVHRNAGAGKALLRHLAGVAIANDCGRCEWSVLDWNEAAIRFYRSIGARPQEEWLTWRLDRTGIEALAAQAPCP